ncbi:endonuclease domain-containing protein [Sphingomonas sp. M6A6_1c]
MLRPEVALARKLRREMSLAEVLLWEQVRGRKLGVKVRKQHPIGPYTADFYCAKARLVIEVDGEAHDRGDQPQRDASRNGFMLENGYRVLRIGAADILRDMDAVITAIRASAAVPLHHSPPASGPPPRAGED